MTWYNTPVAFNMVAFYHDKAKQGMRLPEEYASERNRRERFIMYRQILHTPEGVRDIYNEECRRKNRVQELLHEVLHSYGYEDIQTPTFEFFDVFSREVGTVPSR